MQSREGEMARDALERRADAKDSGLYFKDNKKPMENFQLPFPHLYKMRDQTR